MTSYIGDMQAGTGIADRGGSEVDVEKGLLLGCENPPSALTNNCNPHLHTSAFM